MCYNWLLVRARVAEAFGYPHEGAANMPGLAPLPNNQQQMVRLTHLCMQLTSIFLKIGGWGPGPHQGLRPRQPK